MSPTVVKGMSDAVKNIMGTRKLSGYNQYPWPYHDQWSAIQLSVFGNGAFFLLVVLHYNFPPPYALLYRHNQLYIYPAYPDIPHLTIPSEIVAAAARVCTQSLKRGAIGARPQLPRHASASVGVIG